MAFITIDGQNHIAKKQGDKEQLNINSFVLANVPNLGTEPATRIETIPNSYVVDQLPVTKSGYVNPNQVVYSLVMGSNIGNYEFNWVGLVDDDGVLIAVTYIPLTTKTKNDGAKAGNTFTRNFLVYYTGIQHTTLVNVPAETWQIDFSARLSGIDERERLSNLDIYGHEGFLGDGWKVTGSAGTYNLAAGVGYVGGIRALNKAVQQITTDKFPNEIWLNVSLQGDISDMSTVCEFVIDTGPFEDYVDENGIGHYLTKIADIDGTGEVVEARAMSYLKDLTSPNSKTLFNVAGNENNIVLTSKAGTTKIIEFSDYDEFTFVVSETNTDQVSIVIDQLEAIPLSGVTAANLLYKSALLTVRFIAGEFYVVEQVNPKTGNNVLDIAKLWTDTTDILRPGEYALDGSTISSNDHPIACAIAAASSNYIEQATKDADSITYGGYYGFVTEEDGSITVSLPIVGGEFIRMFDDGRGVDAGRVFAGWAADELKSHNHSYVKPVSQKIFPGGSSYSRIGTSSSTATGNSGGDETRPRSIAFYGKTRL